MDFQEGLLAYRNILKVWFLLVSSMLWGKFSINVSHILSLVPAFKILFGLKQKSLGLVFRGNCRWILRRFSTISLRTLLDFQSIGLGDILAASLDVCQSLDFSLTDVSVMKIASQWIGSIRLSIGTECDSNRWAWKLLLCRRFVMLALFVSHSSFK